MPLAAQQQLLARLYTEAGLRRQFFNQPEEVATAFGLSDCQVREFTRLSPTQVQSFARSLQRKRLNDLAKLLPATCRLLESRLDTLFLRFAECQATQASTKMEEAAEFARFLRQHADAEGLVVHRAAAEMACYEAIRLGAARTALVFHWFYFDVGTLYDDARRKRPLSPRRKLTIAIWFRISRCAPLYHLLVSAAGIRRSKLG
jgi:hypothetical protein